MVINPSPVISSGGIVPPWLERPRPTVPIVIQPHPGPKQATA